MGRQVSKVESKFNYTLSVRFLRAIASYLIDGQADRLTICMVF